MRITFSRSQKAAVNVIWLTYVRSASSATAGKLQHSECGFVKNGRMHQRPWSLARNSKADKIAKPDAITSRSATIQGLSPKMARFTASKRKPSAIAAYHHAVQRNRVRFMQVYRRTTLPLYNSQRGPGCRSDVRERIRRNFNLYACFTRPNQNSGESK